MFRGPAGIPGLLKEGARHFQGQEEAVLRNIDAAKKLGAIVQTSFGPTGMCKLINNFIDKRFLTSDATTIVTELEVQHPAAKLLVMASSMQHTEFGDGTNYVLILGSEMLIHAGELIEDGVHNTSIVQGYRLALERAVEILHKQVILTETGVNELALRSVICTKLRSPDKLDFMARLVSDAISSVMPKTLKEFNADNIRVCCIPGGTLTQSCIINGMVIAREPKTECTHKSNVKICVLATGLEGVQTESTATVLVDRADQLLQFTKGEEDEMERLIKSFSDAGVEALICGGAISALALHYLNKYNMWALSTPSKFDIKRFCRTLRVPALHRCGAPMAEEIGLAEFVGVEERGSQLLSIIRGKDTRVATLLLRGPTRPYLEECERAVDDCVSLICATSQDGRFVPGAGAVECELAVLLDEESKSMSGLEQYSFQKMGQSFGTIAKLLADNAGHNAMETYALLQAAHKSGKSTAGVNVTRCDGEVIRDSLETISVDDDSCMFEELGRPVYDHMLTKEWAIKLAVDAVLTVLQVDHIIMSKPAGGPKLPNQGHWDDAEDREAAF